MNHTDRISLALLVALTGGLSSTTAPAQDAAKPAQDAAKPEEAPKWSQSAGLGLTITEGNSDTLLVTASYGGSKKWRQNEVSLGLNGGYGENNNVRNNEYVKAFGQYNWLFGDAQRWYGFGRLDARYDAIADIDYRFNVAAGLGYYFLKEGVNDNKRFNLSVEVGPGYVVEKIGGRTEEYATGYAAEKFTWKISDRSRLWQTLDFTPQLDEPDNNVTNFELGVGSKLTDAMELRVVLSDTYRSEPAAGRKNNDLKLVASVNYTF
jgi:putative salt-induced outer membrane protein YdiY